MLKVCVVVDVEGFISFKQGNPAWDSWQRFLGRINNLIKCFRYNKKGFEEIYNLVIKKRFPVTFMLVGSLFAPAKKSPKFIDWGYHTLNHKPLTLISDAELGAETKNIYNAKSFSAPMWMIEDTKNPDRIFNALKKGGYRIIVYRGKNEGIKNTHESRISKPIAKYGIACVYTSNWFDGERQYKIKEIIKEIIQNCEKETVYCITTHDFSNKNMGNFEILIDKLKKMEQNGMIKIVNMRQLIRE
jgi:hypothetical protein